MANTIDRFCHVGTALPDTAKVGNLFFLLDAINGNKIYACKVANTWDELTTVNGTNLPQGISVGALVDPATGLYIIS